MAAAGVQGVSHGVRAAWGRGKQREAPRGWRSCAERVRIKVLASSVHSTLPVECTRPADYFPFLSEVLSPARWALQQGASGASSGPWEAEVALADRLQGVLESVLSCCRSRWLGCSLLWGAARGEASVESGGRGPGRVLMCGMEEGQPGLQSESRVLRGGKRRLQGKNHRSHLKAKGCSLHSCCVLSSQP